MDSELIRTFLEVNRTRHFARAAERLFVTPAAVSARIRLLEQHLGTRLFLRSRNNLQLTAAGQRLLPHAENVLRSWNRAVQSVGVTGTRQELVALGSLHSIWQVVLRGWLAEVHDAHPNLVLQVDLLGTPALVSRVRERSLDLALVYEPPRVTDLVAQAVGVVELVLVSDRPGLEAGPELAGYIHVDWGTPFAMTLARDLPTLPDPTLRVDSPEVAHEFLRLRGGAAYLPRPAVGDDLLAKTLFAVAGAPVIERRVYLIRSAEAPVSGIGESVRRHLQDWLRARPDVSL
ncbi:MAG: LysR family transcriptional regulator [bacterium]|jgi:DNA-binding transcriptional LysR family regulator